MTVVQLSVGTVVSEGHISHAACTQLDCDWTPPQQPRVDRACREHVLNARHAVVREYKARMTYFLKSSPEDELTGSPTRDSAYRHACALADELEHIVRGIRVEAESFKMENRDPVSTVGSIVSLFTRNRETSAILEQLVESLRLKQ